MNNDPNQIPTPPDQPLQPIQPVEPVVAPQAPPIQPQQPMASPAPAPTPVAPTMPVTPTPASMPVVPTSGPSSKKGLMIGIIAGVVALIGVVVAIVIVVSILSVSRADYQKAYDTVADVRGSYSDISGVYVGSTSTQTEIENAVDKIKKERAELDADLNEMSELKAVKNDKEVNESYAKLVDKKAKFDAAMDAAIEAYDKILPAISKFSASSISTSTSIESKARAFREALEGISGLQDDNNKKFVDELIATLTKLEKVGAKVDAGRANFRNYDSNATSEYYDLTRDMSTSIRDWQSNLDELADNGEIRDEINDLSDILSKRAAGLKD